MDRRTARDRHRARVRTYRRRRLGALLVLLIIIALIVFGVRGCYGSDAPPPGEPASPSPSPVADTQKVAWDGSPSHKQRLKLRDTIVSETISPKSVVSTGTRYVFAQNMMYRHTITVYDSGTLQLVKTIDDSVTLSEFGFPEKTAPLQGSPVEAAGTPDGRHIYVSQYSMYGAGYDRPGSDTCSPGSGIDDSYVYRVPLASLEIDAVIKVGAVPKFLAVTPDQRYLLVSNWCSYTLSVVDTVTNRQVKSVYLGPYPRGIAVDPSSRHAYVAIMGASDIARIDLKSFSVDWLRGVGAQPRHLSMSPDGRYLYATLNGEGRVARVEVATGKTTKVATGSQPRSMTMAPDGRSLYVVNYASNTLSKVRTSDMKVVQTVNTNPAPIGITYDIPTRSVWVCCYGGSIMVFDDSAQEAAATL